MAPPATWLYLNRNTLAHVIASVPAEPGQEPATRELLAAIRERATRAVMSPQVPEATKQLLRDRWAAIRGWAKQHLVEGVDGPPESTAATEANHVCNPPAELVALVGRRVVVTRDGQAAEGTVDSVSCSGSVYVAHRQGFYTTVPWEAVAGLEVLL